MLWSHSNPGEFNIHSKQCKIQWMETSDSLEVSDLNRSELQMNLWFQCLQREKLCWDYLHSAAVFPCHVCTDRPIFKPVQCHSNAFIHHGVNDNIVVDSGEESEPGGALKIKTSLRKTSIRLFHPQQWKPDFHQCCCHSDSSHHGMSRSIVFNKASEELPAPVRSVRLIPTATECARRGKKQLPLVWNVCGIVTDTKRDITPWWIMSHICRITAPSPRFPWSA